MMDNICGKYAVMKDGKKLGTASVEADGIRMRISGSVERSSAADGRPFRLAAVCGGRAVPIGVMLPSDKEFCCSRLFSKKELHDRGITNISGFTITDEGLHREPALPGEAWRTTDAPWEYIAEGEFRRIFSGCRSALVLAEGDITCLAIPITEEDVSPVMPVFCLGEIRKIDGRMHLVFKISRGKLLI